MQQITVSGIEKNGGFSTATLEGQVAKLITFWWGPLVMTNSSPWKMAHL